jgi:PAS domain-containing protein
MTARAIRVEWEPAPGTDERLLKLHAHWLSICPNGLVPSRKDFKPAAIGSLLPFVFLVDVTSGPRNFRFRLVGTAFAPVIGREITGLLIDEVFPPQYNLEVLEGWNAVVEEYGPNWGSGDLWLKERDLNIRSFWSTATSPAAFLPPALLQSYATSVDAQGNVGGWATDADGTYHAILWQPIQ